MDTAGGDYKTREKKMNHRGTETQRREEREKEKRRNAPEARKSLPPLSLLIPFSPFISVSSCLCGEKTLEAHPIKDKIMYFYV
jgi:hypothetical protein